MHNAAVRHVTITIVPSDAQASFLSGSSPIMLAAVLARCELSLATSVKL